MKRLLVVGAAVSLVLGGLIGHAASTITPDSVLLNGAPCTITTNGQSSAGTCSGAFVQTAATPAPSPTPSSGGITPFYAATSFWNLPIGPAPVLDPNSAAIVQAAVAGSGAGSNFANTAAWGRAMVFSHNTDPLYAVGCTQYDCGTTIAFHIPVGATPETGSDHHLVVINLDTNEELDMWLASFSGGTWSAGSRYLTAANGWGALCALGLHCGAAVAAGFAAFGGVVRPEEIQQGHIDHALALTASLTRSGFIACPATHTDGPSTDPASIPEAARIQLDPAFNVDGQSWPQWEKVIAHALQTYGAYIYDTGGSLGLAGQGNQNGGLVWSSVGVPDGPSLSNLPWGRFRVLLIQSC